MFRNDNGLVLYNASVHPPLIFFVAEKPFFFFLNKSVMCKVNLLSPNQNTAISISLVRSQVLKRSIKQSFQDHLFDL